MHTAVLISTTVDYDNWYCYSIAELDSSKEKQLYVQTLIPALPITIDVMYICASIMQYWHPGMG